MQGISVDCSEKGQPIPEDGGAYITEYEDEELLWFRWKKFDYGDDMDRVLIKSDG